MGVTYSGVNIANANDGESIQRNNTDFISAPLPLSTVEGRLTLTTAVPVTTADVTGATSIYFTPYKGDRISLYDGTRWKAYKFTEISLALGTLTNAKPYDVFIYDNSGTLTLEFLVWTDATTRATALVLQNGVLVKSGATTRRYLGTFYTTATTTTEDSVLKRFLYNHYNRVRKSLITTPGYSDNNAGTTWTSSSTTYTPANGGTGSRLQWVSQGEDEVMYSLNAFFTGNATGGTYNGIGEDSTTSAFITSIYQNLAARAPSTLVATRRFTPGFHFIEFLVRVDAGTSTWDADTPRGGSAADPRASTLVANVMA